jgi:hypothetical protein
MDALLDMLLIVAPVLAVSALLVALQALRVARAGASTHRDAPGPREHRSMATFRAAGDDDGTDIGALADRLAALEVGSRAGGRAAPVGIGLVRFNAFDDTGGNQSFALALLDGAGDGVVLSSLHSRQTTRLYVKHVAGGVPDAALSDEESQALRQAGSQRPPQG